MSVKGSWSRVTDTESYAENYNAIFKKRGSDERNKTIHADNGMDAFDVERGNAKANNILRDSRKRH